MTKRIIRGIEIAFDLHGDPHSGDELIVFIHGVGADRTAWKSQHEFFNKHGYVTCAIDMRGTGDSQARYESGEVLPISIAEFALDVDALIEDLGYFSAHWVGNSMGGVIIQEALMRGLSSLDKAVLCNTFAKHPDSAQILPRAATALRTRGLEAFAEERIPLVLRKDTDPEALAEVVHAMARKDPEAYLASWRATWSPDYRERLYTFDTPVLVIAGSDDKITPVPLSEELATSIPNAKLHVIQGAGHISNMDRTDEFNAVVLDFLRS